MRIVATIEARLYASRLWGKVLLEVCGKPMLQWLIEQVKQAKSFRSPDFWERIDGKWCLKYPLK